MSRYCETSTYRSKGLIAMELASLPPKQLPTAGMVAKTAKLEVQKSYFTNPDKDTTEYQMFDANDNLLLSITVT